MKKGRWTVFLLVLLLVLVAAVPVASAAPAADLPGWGADTRVEPPARPYLGFAPNGIAGVRLLR